MELQTNNYLKYNELILTLLNKKEIYENADFIAKYDDLSSMIFWYIKYIPHKIYVNELEKINNHTNNAILNNYIKKNYINIANIENDILIILNLLSAELLQVYEILTTNIIIQVECDDLLVVDDNCTYIILPYTSLILLIYNNNINDITSKETIILDFLYYTLYNINNSMNINIDTMICFKNVKNNYKVDKLYICRKRFDNYIKRNIIDTNEFYYLINFIIYDFKNNKNVTKYLIVLNDKTLESFEYKNKYILNVFFKYIININKFSEINKKINKLINKNKYIMKEIIKFIIIISSISIILGEKHLKTLSFFYNFIKNNFNYNDLDEIINITNNLNISRYLENYHKNILNIISNFKELCDEMLIYNSKIFHNSRLKNIKIHLLNNDYIFNKNNQMEYIKTCYSLLEKNNNNDIIEYFINYINNKYPDNNQKFCLIFDNDVCYLKTINTIYFNESIQIFNYNSNNINFIQTIINNRLHIYSKFSICINIFTKIMHQKILTINLINDRYITIESYNNFDTAFYNLDINTKNIAYKNIHLYYKNNGINKFIFVDDSLKLIYNNEYNNVGTLLENIINIHDNSTIITYHLAYIVYVLNIHSDLFDYIFKKLYDENIINTIEFKYNLLKFLKVMLNKNILFLYPYHFYNIKDDDLHFKYKNKNKQKYDNIILKIKNSPMLYDIFCNFKNIDNTIEIYFDF